LDQFGCLGDVGTSDEVVVVTVSHDHRHVTITNLVQTVIFTESLSSAVVLRPDEGDVSPELLRHFVVVSGGHAVAEQPSLGLNVLPGRLDFLRCQDDVGGQGEPVLEGGQFDHLGTDLGEVEEGEEGDEEAEPVGFALGLEALHVVLVDVGVGVSRDVKVGTIQHDQFTDDIWVVGLLLQLGADLESQTGTEGVTSDVVWALRLDPLDVLDVVLSNGLHALSWD